MDKNQRKEIVKQIKDLSQERKGVSVANARTHGFSLGNRDSMYVGPEPVIADLLVNWEVSFYNTENIPSYVGLELFTNLDLWGNPNVYTGYHSSLNGISHQTVSYGKILRYKTILVCNKSGTEEIRITGAFKANLIINGVSVLVHNGTSQEHQSTVSFSFLEAVSYTINLIVVCNNESVVSGIISLGSIFFAYCTMGEFGSIPPPVNAFASTNLLNLIDLSWEQLPSIDLVGGGVEVWARQENSEEEDFNFLARVPFPEDSYTHNTMSVANILNSNHRFDVFLPYEDEEEEDGGIFLREQLPQSSDGLLNFGVVFNQAAQAQIVESSLPDFTNQIDVQLGINEPQSFNDVLAYAGFSSSPEFNSGTPVIFPLTGTTYSASIITPSASSFIQEHALNAVINVSWDVFDLEADIYPDATVNIRVTADSTVTDYTPSMYGGGFSITLTIAQTFAWRADSSAVSVMFSLDRTDTGDAGYSGSGTVAISSVFLLPSGIDGTPSQFRLYTSRIPVNGNQQISANIIQTHSFVSNPVTVQFYYYTATGTVAGFTNKSLIQEDSVVDGPWKRYIVSDIVPASAERVVLYWGVSATAPANVSYSVQSVSLIINNNIAIPPDQGFYYKLRNYTASFRYSAFSSEFLGKSAQEVNSLQMLLGADGESRRVVSPFRGIPVKILSSAELDSLEVWTETSDGNNLFNLDLVRESTNNTYDFVFKPLLEKAIVFDTFKYEYELLSGDSSLPTPIDNNMVSREESPARGLASWAVSRTNLYAIFQSRPGVGGGGVYWEESPEEDTFRTYVSTNASLANYGYKKYNLSGQESFYKNIYGLPDSENGRYLHREETNQKKLSVGIVLRPNFGAGDITGSDEITIARTSYIMPNEFPVYAIKLKRHSGSFCVEVAVTLFDYSSMEHVTRMFRRSLSTANDWQYIHFSFDILRANDSQYTYLRTYRLGAETPLISSTVPYNYASFTENGHYFNWSINTEARLGIVGKVGSPTLVVDFDLCYLTCGIIKRDIMDSIVSYASETKNSKFPLFGHNSGDDIVIHAAGFLSDSADMENFNLEFPVDGGIVSADGTLTADFELPDGTVWIMRDNFVYSQEDLDDPDPVQPIVTFTRYNRILPEFSTPHSTISNIRFSNDSNTWSTWRQFSQQTLYPWELRELSPPEVEAADRTVWAQVVTEAGNSSDFVIIDSHRDDIYYNPLGSVGDLNSFNYVEGVSGWNISLAGEAEFNDVRVRNNAIVTGKILSTVKGTEFSGQLGFATEKTVTTNNVFTELYSRYPWKTWNHGPFDVYSRVEAPGIEVMKPDYAPSPFDMTTGEPNAGVLRTRANVCMNEFVPDIYDRNVFYVTGNLGDGTSFYVKRINVNTNESDILEIPHQSWWTNVKEYGVSPSIALGSRFLYVAFYKQIYKIEKDLSSILSTTTITSDKIITGLKCSTSLSGLTKLYVGQTYNDTIASALFLSITDPGGQEDSLSIVGGQFPTGYITFTPHDEEVNLGRPVALNTFDCDGQTFLTIDGQGNIYRIVLNNDGDFTGPAGSPVVTTGDWSKLYGSFEYDALDTSDTPTPLNFVIRAHNFKRPQSIKLFGTQAIVWSHFTSDLNRVYHASGYTLNGIYNILGVVDLDTFDEEKISSCFFVPWNQGLTSWDDTTYTPVLAKVSRPDFDYDMAQEYNQHRKYKSFMPKIYESCWEFLSSPPFWFEYSWGGYETIPPVLDFSRFDEYAIGFGVPTYYNGNILVPYTNANNGNTKPSGSSILKFAINGNDLEYSGRIGSDVGKSIFSILYDGQYLWQLSVDPYANTASPYTESRPIYVQRKLI